jgi:hypothetical protein
MTALKRPDWEITLRHAGNVVIPPGKQMHVLAIVLVLLVVPSVAQTQQREKLAEGEFQTMPAEQMTDPKQTWVLWREADGKFHVEDHFSFFEDPSLMALAYVGHLSKELQREVADKFGQTQLDVTFSPDWKTESLVLRGDRVSDGSMVEIAKCKVDSSEVSCKGLRHGAKLKKVASEELLFSFPFPFLVRHLALTAKQAPSKSARVTGRTASR